MQKMENFNDEFGDLSGYKILSFEEVSKGFEGNKNPLEGISRRSFEEISYENKIGTQDKCKTTEGKFYSGNMNENSLLNDLSNRSDEKFFFYYQNYELSNPGTIGGISPTVIQSTSTTYVPNKYFQYTISNESKLALLTIELNERACFINLKNTGSIFHLDPEKKEIEFRLEFVYNDYLDKRVFNTKTGLYNLDKIYNAVIISTSDINGFVALSQKLGVRNDARNEIINLFAEKVLKTKEPSELKFLYENMPDFVAKKLLEKLGVDTENVKNSRSGNEEIIWRHLEILSSSMDNQGLFSWNTDFSGAMLNILKVFGDSKFLFEKFKSNQTLIKTIFKNLEGESVVNGEKCSNKIAFSSFISSLCLHNGMEGLRKIDKAFSFGKYNGVNSDDDLPREENGNDFFLQKEKEVPSIDYLPLESFNEIIPDNDSGAYYHPMDMVLLVDADSKEKYPDIVAAILIKAIAEANEELEREKNIRIGFDILGIALGAIALATSGNPLILTAAIADVVVNTTDVFVQGFDKDIIALEGGEKFLQDWNKIYYSVNSATALVALPDLLRNGMRLIQLAWATGKAKAINFIKACIVKIILDKNIITFTGNTLKEGKAWVRVLDAAEAIKATANYFNDTNLIRLYDKGVVIVEVAENGKKEFAFIYKNEVILRGVATDRNFKNIVYGFYKNLYHPFKLIEKLEELYRGKIFLKYAEKFKEKFHHHFDGEILIKEKGGEDILELFGAHNHEVRGTKIQIGIIRKPTGVKSIHDLPNDIPFKANVEIKYNASIVKKKNTSSFFPKNWDIKRVKEEVALVYNEMLKSGKVYNPNATNRKFDFPCSNGSFRIQIEFDELGNLTSAYPIVN